MTLSRPSKTITVFGMLYPVSVEWSRRQNRCVTEAGTARVYDRESSEKFARIVLKNDHSNVADMRKFIEENCLMSSNTFVLTPDSGCDIGNGAGGATVVRYWASNFIEKQQPYHVYRYEIIVRLEDQTIGGAMYGDDFEDVGYVGGPLS